MGANDSPLEGIFIEHLPGIVLDTAVSKTYKTPVRVELTFWVGHLNLSVVCTFSAVGTLNLVIVVELSCAL